MNTEFATDYLLQHLLGAKQNPQLFIEIGLGSCDWSFQWAASSGFRCVAVEPLPVPALRAACNDKGVLLVEAAVGRVAGEALMHLGELDGFGIPDTNSLRANWWAVGGQTTTVPMLTLSDVVQRAGEGSLACLKVDVEGAEAEVLQGLQDLEESRLPLLVAFEYGGGGTRLEGTGGWSQESIAGTEECLKMLAAKGYAWGLVCERSLSQPEVFETQALRPGLTDLLDESFEVGNLIVSRSAPPADLKPLLENLRRRDRWTRLGTRLASLSANTRFQLHRYQAAIQRRMLGR